MNISKKLKLGFLMTMLATPIWQSQIVQAGEEQRAPPEARSAGTLSEPVMRAISEIQEMMTPEDPNDPADLEGAKRALDELRDRRYERMNDFEKQTILNFYTNYYLTLENYPEAIRIFKELLTIEDLREDVRLRTLRSLGQLEAAEENWQNSIDFYQQWRDLSVEEDDIVYRGLAYAHYQIEQFNEALPFWIAYMEMVKDEGAELGRDDYAFLNGLYFTLEDYPNALELTKTMVMLFDNPTDWTNLYAIYASLDNEANRVQAMNLVYLKGYFDDETPFLNLGQSLAGSEIPLSGARIVENGYAGGFVEESAENYTVLTQMYLIGNDFRNALEPGRKAAEMDETGDGYDTLGYIHYVLRDYAAAVEAFQTALDKGQLSDRADTLLFLARALLELNRFDEAATAAADAAEAGDANDRQSANNYLKFVTDSKARFNILADRREAAKDFYRAYPAVQ